MLLLSGFEWNTFPYHSFLEVQLYESLPVVPVKCADFLNERSEIVSFPSAGEYQQRVSEERNLKPM